MRKLMLLVFAAAIFNSCRKEQFSLLWKKLDIATEENLYSINILGDTLYVFGGATYDKGILVTTEINSEATTVDSIAPKVIYSSIFKNENEALACGYDGKIYLTDNGGVSWNIMQTQSWRALQKISSRYGWNIAVGGLGNKGAVQSNYEPDWQWHETLFDKELKGVAIVDSFKAFVAGNGIVLKTEDRGANWQPLDVKGDMFSDIQFVNETTGYILGYSGLLLKTTDGGNHWKTIKIQKANIINRGYFNALYFLDENTGFICGNSGTLLKTTNGGNTWQQADYPHATDFFDVYYNTTLNKGFACGSRGILIQFSF